MGKQQSLEEDYGIGKISRGEYEVRTIENAQSLLRSQAQVFPQDAKQYEIGTRLLSLYSEYQNEFTNNQFKRGSEESIGSNEIESRVLENRQESNEDRSRTSNQGADQSGDATQKNQGLQHLEQWLTNTVGAGIAQLTINILASKSEEVATKMKNVLSEKIDKTDNEKAATDLNSRMMAEIGYLQAEQIKQQALQNQQVSEGVAKALDGERSAILYSRDETLKAPR